MILKFKKGFSLVELLVVIAIIGILAAVGITAYSGYTANAKVKASTSQNSQVVAVVNAEFAKCAGGAGTFVWGGNCNAAVAASSLVTYFAHDGTGMPLKNPYKTDESAVSTDFSATGGVQPLTAGAETVNVPGRIAIFCATDVSCLVHTDNGEGGANITNLVLRY